MTCTESTTIKQGCRFRSLWMILQLPLLTTHQQHLRRQQWRWWRYRRRVFSRGLLASRRPRVCLAASYLIRRLSTALLGVGHHRVAPCTCSSWPTASEPHGITFLFKTLRFPLLSPLLGLFFSSIYSTPIRYFPLARAFIALVLVSWRKRKWAKDSGATLLRVLEKSKPLRALTSNPSLSFLRPIQITSRWARMFSHGDYRKKTSCTRIGGEVMKNTAEK